MSVLQKAANYCSDHANVLFYYVILHIYRLGFNRTFIYDNLYSSWLRNSFEIFFRQLKQTFISQARMQMRAALWKVAFSLFVPHVERFSAFIIGRECFLGMLEAFWRESTRHTYAHQHTQLNATSLLHFSEQGRPRLCAITVLLSMSGRSQPPSLSF